MTYRITINSGTSVTGTGVVARYSATVTNNGKVYATATKLCPAITLDAGGQVYNYGGVRGETSGIDAKQSASIVNSGAIFAGAFVGIQGGAGIELDAGGSVINAPRGYGGSPASIIGGGSGDVYRNPTQAHGGAGVLSVGYARLQNSGLIEGGYVHGGGGAGGYGVEIYGGAYINNSGKIYGGADTKLGRYGGAGVDLPQGGAVVNSGLIKGGGSVGKSRGVSGMMMGGAGTITNTGTITGMGPARGSAPYTVGYGVLLSAGGSVTNGAPGDNKAVIQGYVGLQMGSGGAGTVTNFGAINGYGGHSVVFTSANDRLIAEAGSSFGDPVVGGGGALELAGGAGQITGVGGAATLRGAVSANFSGFGSYQVDSGADWTLAGTNSLSVGQTMTAYGALKLVATASLNNAGLIDAAGGGTIKLRGVLDNGGKLKADSGGSIVVRGALDNADVVKTVGGDLTVDGAVTGAGRAAVNGGTLTFAGSFEQNVTFTGSTGELVLAQSQSYGGQISGFSTSGSTSLDLEDVGFVDAGQASFLGTTTSGVLTVSDGTHTAHLTLIGDYTNSVFIASSDGHGGTIIVDPTTSAAVRGFSEAMAQMGGGSGGYLRRTSSPAGYSHPTLIAPR